MMRVSGRRAVTLILTLVLVENLTEGRFVDGTGRRFGGESDGNGKAVFFVGVFGGGIGVNGGVEFFSEIVAILL